MSVEVMANGVGSRRVEDWITWTDWRAFHLFPGAREAAMTSSLPMTIVPFKQFKSCTPYPVSPKGSADSSGRSW